MAPLTQCLHYFIVETIVSMCILDRKTTQFQADHDMHVPHSGQYFKMYYFLFKKKSHLVNLESNNPIIEGAFWRGQDLFLMGLDYKLITKIKSWAILFSTLLLLNTDAQFSAGLFVLLINLLTAM